MKTKWNIIGVILVAIGVAAYWYYTREASLLDAPGGVCPRCQSNDVGKWVYGLVDENSEDSTLDKKRESASWRMYHNNGFSHVSL